MNNNTLKVISISKKEIIKEINCPFLCYAINSFKDKGIFLVGGKSKDIMIHRNDNYECIKIIKNAHDDDINGFIESKYGKIISYSNRIIKFWDI